MPKPYKGAEELPEIQIGFRNEGLEIHGVFLDSESMTNINYFTPLFSRNVFLQMNLLLYSSVSGPLSTKDLNEVFTAYCV